MQAAGCSLSSIWAGEEPCPQRTVSLGSGPAQAPFWSAPTAPGPGAGVVRWPGAAEGPRSRCGRVGGECATLPAAPTLPGHVGLRGAKSQGPRRRSPAGWGARGRVLLWLQLCGKGVGGWRAGGPTHPGDPSPRGARRELGEGRGRPAAPGPSYAQRPRGRAGGSRSRRARPTAGRAQGSALTLRSWPPAPGGASDPRVARRRGASSERPPTPGAVRTAAGPGSPEPWADPACRPPPPGPPVSSWAEASCPDGLSPVAATILAGRTGGTRRRSWGGEP